MWILGSSTKQPKQPKQLYPLPFFYEVLNTITMYEAYSFLNGYLGYHQIFIAPKDTYKTTFVMGPQTFQET